MDKMINGPSLLTGYTESKTMDFFRARMWQIRDFLKEVR